MRVAPLVLAVVVAIPARAEWVGRISVPAVRPDPAVLLEALDESQAGSGRAAEKDWANALVHYQRALVLQPDNDVYLGNVAGALWWLGELERAGDHLRRAAAAAARIGARDRMALWHQKLSALFVTPPAWANDKKAKAMPMPSDPEALAALGQAGQLYQAAAAAMQRGDFDEASTAASSALDICERVLGADHLATTVYVNLTADVLMAQEQADQARPRYQRVARVATAALGKRHPETLVYRNNLAMALRQLGEHTRAEAELRQVVKDSVRAWGDRHPMTATYVWILAATVKAQGRSKEAARLLEGVYRRRLAALGSLHPETLGALDEVTALLMELEDFPRMQPLMVEEARVTALVHGESSAPALQAAHNLGDLFIARQEYLPAAHQYERTWRLLQRATEPAVDPDIVLTGLNAAYVQLNRMDRLVDVWERRVAYSRVKYGESHPTTWIALKTLTEYYMEVGRYADAMPLAEFLVEAAPATDPRRVTALSNIGLLHHARGDFRSARASLERAVELCDRMHDRNHPATLEVFNNVALVYSAMGLYHLARPLYEQVLRARFAILPEKDPETLRSMHNLGSIYMKQGLLDEATPLLESTLNLRIEVLGETHASTLESLNSLALLKSSRGLYAEARPLLERAWRLRREHLGPSHPRTLRSQGDLALFYVQQGLLARAEPLSRSLVELRRETLGERHPDTLTAMNDLALVLHHKGDNEAAAPLFERALALSRETLGEHHPDTLKLTNNLAEAQLYLGRRADALRSREHTVKIARHVLGDRHPETLIYIGNLASMAFRQGDHARAEPLYEEALAGKREVFGPTHPETVIALENTALSFQAKGDMERATALWREHLAATTSFLDRVLWGADEETRQSYIRMQYMNDLFLVSFFEQIESYQDALSLLLNRKGLLLRVSSEVSATARASRDPALRELAESLAVVRRELAERTLSGPGGQPRALFDARQRELEAAVRSREAAIGQAVRQLARARVQVTTEQVVEALAQDEVLLELVIYAPHNLRTMEIGDTAVAALVVDPAAEPAVSFVGLGRAKPAYRAVQVLRDAVRAPGRSPGSLQESARQLYEQLWAPLRDRVVGKRNVYVAPDGFLHTLPFAALLDGEGRHLVANHDITVVASGRDLVVPPPVGEGGAPEIFSAPAYHHPAAKPRERKGRTRATQLSDVRFVPLPGTAREAQRIAQLFSERREPAVQHSGVDALEAAVLAVEHPRVLHLATHGFFLDHSAAPLERRDHTRGLVVGTKKDGRPRLAASPNPLLRAGLAFAGANLGVRGKKLHDGSDGVLTALEVLDVDLVGTDLVVLSACDTGVGQLLYGGGVAGLRSAFQEAGAKAVLSTLWPIDDAGTAAFMEQFYAAFLSGAPPQEALRRVQRQMIADERWRHPFYWAPFVVAGPDR